MLAPSVGGDGSAEYRPLVMLLAGGVLGGAVLGLILAIPAYLLMFAESARLGILWSVAGLSIIATLIGNVRRWIPQRVCQVSGSLPRRYGLSKASLLWGLKLGIALRTLIVTPALYGLLAIGAAQQPPSTVLALSELYATARVLTIDVFALVIGRRESHGTYDRCAMVPGVGIERKLRLPLVALIALAAVLSS